MTNNASTLLTTQLATKYLALSSQKKNKIASQVNGRWPTRATVHCNDSQNKCIV